MDTSTQLNDGLIALDSEKGIELGFTSQRFGSMSYLWEKDGAIIISFIMSLRRGNFRNLVHTILSKGYRVEIPTPLGRMRQIVEKCGYVQQLRLDEDYGEVEVWVLENG